MSWMRSSSGSMLSSSSISSPPGKTGGDDAGATTHIRSCPCCPLLPDLRLEGGAADDEGPSSSASLPRFLPPPSLLPRFAADMLDRSGELVCRQIRLVRQKVEAVYLIVVGVWRRDGKPALALAGFLFRAYNTRKPTRLGEERGGIDWKLIGVTRSNFYSCQGKYRCAREYRSIKSTRSVVLNAFLLVAMIKRCCWKTVNVIAAFAHQASRVKWFSLPSKIESQEHT